MVRTARIATSWFTASSLALASWACKGDTPLEAPSASPVDTAPAAATTPAPTGEPDAAATVEVAEPAPVGPPPIVLDGTETAEPASADRVYCFGTIAGHKGHAVSDAGGRILLKASGPAGAVVTAQDKSYTLGPDGVVVQLDPLVPMLGAKAGEYDRLHDKVSFEVDWKLPDGKTGSGELECSVGVPLGKALGAVAKGPLRWPDEGEQRFTHDVIAVSDGGGVSLYGTYDATLYNADFIALEREHVRTLSSCNYRIFNAETGQATGESVTKERFAVDIVVKVYDRRSGKLLKSRTFAAPNPQCPEQIPADEAIRAAGERGDTGTFYVDFIKPRPDDAPGELPPPNPKVVVDLVGEGLPVRSLPSIDELDTRVRALGLKLSSDPFRSSKDDSVEYYDTSLDLGDGDFVSITAKDWKRSRNPTDEYAPAVVYAVGPRGAILVEGPREVVVPTLKLLASRPFEDNVAIRAAIEATGWKASTPIEKSDNRAEGVPSLREWVTGYTRGNEMIAVTYADWGEVVDGKVPEAVVARSQDGYLYVHSYVAGKAKEIADKLLK